MPFNIFSQPQGPRIDTSLFPQSAAQGAQVGQSLGTPLSNAIEGGIKGFETGQQFRAREGQIEAVQQQNVLRQNDIERLPVTNELQELQLERERLNNIKLQEDIKTLPIDQQIKVQQLQNSKLLQQKTQQAIDQEAITNDPVANRQLALDQKELIRLQRDDSDFARRQLAQSLESGRFNQLFRLYQEDDVKRIYDTSLPYYSPGFKEMYTDFRTSGDRHSYQEELTKQALKDQFKTTSALQANTTASRIRGASNLTDFDLIKSGSLVTAPAFLPGTNLLDPSGKSRTDFSINGKVVQQDVDDSFVREWTAARENYFLLENLKNPAGVTAQRQEAGPASANTPSPVAGPTDLSPTQQRRLDARNKIRERAGKPPVSPSSYKAEFEAQTFSYEEPQEITAPEKILNNAALFGKPELIQAIALVPAVTEIESSGKQSAVSPKGARGLMQVMPPTFKYVTDKYKLKDRDINNPVDNVEVGTIYLAEQIKNFGSSPGQGLELALAAYNTGPGRVSDALRNAEEKSWVGVKKELKKMLSEKAYNEVSQYPDKVLQQALRLAELKK